MKKYLKIIIVVFGLGLLCFLGNKTYTKMQYKSTVAKTLQTVPNFSFVTIENKPFTNENLNTKKTIIFIYFNSGCEYCQHEAVSIEKSIKEFKNVELIFVSDESTNKIKEFAIKYKLINYDQITFLSDPRGHFSTRFDATSIPYILIYNKDKQLVKRHKGQLSVENLVSLLRN